VVARLRYVRNDGKSDTEDRWLKMVLVDGAMRLDGSGRIGSVDETQPLPPPTFSSKAIDRVLLSADQLSTVLGVEVSNDPSLGGTILAMDSSSYGTGDQAGQVTPRSCVGVVFTGEHEVYSGGLG
jgi:serine/threonine-protein kinase